jgi:beta-1,4-mannosyl-glycoprotein beta-1,4-N-acetylglucosaminyltransferase
VRIIEAVLFNNELELLEARLHEGAGVVDRWIIIESPETFTGKPKPTYFQENRRRFREFNDKITRLEVSPAPAEMTPWQREMRQRDALGDGLSWLGGDDLIALSDGDELTRSTVWGRVTSATQAGQSVSLHKPTWYYTLTWALPDSGPAVSSFRTKASRVGALMDRGSVGEWANDLRFPIIKDSGWHLSCLGGPIRLLEKIQSFSHQELNTPDWATYENCRRLIAEGIDCAPERGVELTRTEPAGPKWLITEGVAKYPWLLTGEDPCTPPS